MKSADLKRTLLYGIGVWLALTLVSLVLVPVEMANSPLFESLKSIALATVTAVFLIMYLKKVKQTTWLTGLVVGAAWAVITVALDTVLFALGLFGDFSFTQYCNDVATSYAMMPILGALMLGYLKAR